jgi:hypothetical protein
MVLSLTNPSLIGLEMMACGLACVELASESMVASFGRAGALRLTEPDPLGLYEALERILEDSTSRSERGASGTLLTSQRTWRHAADQIQDALPR